jgi:hypothetical protein
MASKILVNQRGYPVAVHPPQKIRPTDLGSAQLLDLLDFLRIGGIPQTGKNQT